MKKQVARSLRSVFLMRWWLIILGLLPFAGLVIADDQGSTDLPSPPFLTLSVEPLLFYGTNFFTLSTRVASASSTQGLTVESSSTASRNGFGFGLRAWGSVFQDILMLGPEFSWLPSLSLSDQDRQNQVTAMKLVRISGLFGIRLPGRGLRFWVGVQLRDRWWYENASGWNFYEGTSWKMGLGFSAFSVMTATLEYLSAHYPTLQLADGRRIVYPHTQGGQTTQAPRAGHFLVGISLLLDVFHL